MLLNTSTRFRHLGLALSIFYLLYNVTTFYSVSLYKLYPSSVYNLATPFDSVIPFIPAMIVPYSWSLILFVGSFFLVHTSIQLSLLTYRLILTTVFACFIFIPLGSHFIGRYLITGRNSAISYCKWWTSHLISYRLCMSVMPSCFVCRYGML